MNDKIFLRCNECNEDIEIARRLSNEFYLPLGWNPWYRNKILNLISNIKGIIKVVFNKREKDYCDKVQMFLTEHTWCGGSQGIIMTYDEENDNCRLN